MPKQFGGWKITRVLLWYHCQHELWESKWIHSSEIPVYSSSPFSGGMKWWLRQRLPE